MNNWSRVRPKGLLALSLLATTVFASPTLAQSYVFTNAKVYTPTGFVEAIAVENGRITAVGDAATVQKSAPQNAEVMDLKGQTVFPGLHDMHVHPLFSGQSLRSCRFTHGGELNDLTKTLQECVARAQKGEWVTGGQWQGGEIPADKLHKKTLDAIAPDNPVSLSDVSLHSVWANSKALELAGITRDTPNPEGGIIERDAKGEPTGILRESAAYLVRKAIPANTPAQNAELIKTALDTLVSLGITTLVDAKVRPDDIAAYLHLANSHGITPKVRGCYSLQSGYGGITDHPTSLRANDRPNLTFDCIKIYLDGVPTDSHTAAMIEPYVGGGKDPNKPESGLLFLPQEVVDETVIKYDKEGFSVKFHAAGDLSARTGINAVEAARKANGPNGPIHDVGHLTFITLEDIARAKDLNMTLEFSPYFWYPSAITLDIVRATGPERNERAWPLRDGLQSGANVVAGSDWSVVDDPNPWIAIESMVTRRVPGAAANSDAYAPNEAISLEDAIRIFTLNSARQLGLENQSGSLEVGKVADLVILDKNPFEIPVQEIHKIKNVTTMIDGKIVYRAE